MAQLTQKDIDRILGRQSIADRVLPIRGDVLRSPERGIITGTWADILQPITSNQVAEFLGAADVQRALNSASYNAPITTGGSIQTGGIRPEYLMAALAVTPTGKGKKAADIAENVTKRAIAAPKEVDVASRFKGGEKAGIYRGSEAFGGITPQKLGSMRSEYLNKMEQGVGGRNWYDESSADINRWVGGNQTQADQLANILAITSAETPVASNLMYANKGWNQYLTGAPLDTGKRPTRMGKEITSIMENPELSASGLKRSPFSAGLSVDWRGKEFASRPTHDIHDVRAWGITDPKTGGDWKKGVGDAGHRFLDEQSNWVTQEALKRNLGGVSDWNPYRAQAAAWIAQKAQKEGKPISVTAKHYGSYAPDYQALISREWIAGNNTGHLPELLNAPESLKQAYSDAMENTIRGNQGIDQFARDVGALSDRVTPNIGFYEGEFNPAFMSRIGVGKATGSQSIDPASANVMKAITAGHGLLGTQKQSAWNYFGNQIPIKDASGIRLSGSNLSNEQFKELTKTLQSIGGDVPQIDPSGGVRLLNFVDEDKIISRLKESGMSDSEIAKQLPKEVENQRTAFSKALKPIAKQYGLTPTFHELSSDIYPFNTTAQWSAKPYIQAIEESGLEKQTSAALQKHAGNLMTTANEFAAKNNLTQAKWFNPMMQALRDGGLPELKKLVDAGVVPAFMYVNLKEEDKKK